jgi:hypothetical protein
MIKELNRTERLKNVKEMLLGFSIILGGISVMQIIIIITQISNYYLFLAILVPAMLIYHLLLDIQKKIKEEKI